MAREWSYVTQKIQTLSHVAKDKVWAEVGDTVKSLFDEAHESAQAMEKLLNPILDAEHLDLAKLVKAAQKSNLAEKLLNRWMLIRKVLSMAEKKIAKKFGLKEDAFDELKQKRIVPERMTLVKTQVANCTLSSAALRDLTPGEEDRLVVVTAALNGVKKDQMESHIKVSMLVKTVISEAQAQPKGSSSSVAQGNSQANS